MEFCSEKNSTKIKEIFTIKHIGETIKEIIFTILLIIFTVIYDSFSVHIG